MSSAPLLPQVKENGIPTPVFPAPSEDEEEEGGRVEKEAKGVPDDQAPLVDGETTD